MRLTRQPIPFPEIYKYDGVMPRCRWDLGETWSDPLENSSIVQGSLHRARGHGGPQVQYEHRRTPRKV